MQQPINPVKQEFTYTFKYESDSESIDINTLLLSQIHFTTVLNEIKNEVAAGSNLKIRVTPLQKGSVPFNFILDLSWLESLFSAADFAYNHSKDIIEAFLALIYIRKELKGKKAKKITVDGDDVVIETEDTEIRVNRKVYKIYEDNATVDQALKKGFEAIDSDEDITGITLLDEAKKEILTVSRAEFPDMIAPNENFEKLSQTDPAKKETLSIFKVVFDKGYKWQFYREGRKISATIADDAFMERVNKGERFAKGDTLEVELEVSKVFDKTMDIYIEKGFNIINVIKHTPKVSADEASPKLFNDENQ